MFASPAAPNASLVHVTPPRRWSDATFTVDCGWSLPLEQRSCGWAGARSSAAVERALEAARAAGGGIVYLPRGQYFVDGPLIVPEGTRLRGECAALDAAPTPPPQLRAVQAAAPYHTAQAATLLDCR